MQLTTKKLQSLIQEMVEDRFNKEQKRKIMDIIRKTRSLFRSLEEVLGFFPTVINGVYYYNEKEKIKKAVFDTIRSPHVKKAIMSHYAATKEIATILEEINQFLVLLESLEIEGNIAYLAQGMLYGGTSGPTTVNGHRVKLYELYSMVDSGIMFLEDVHEVDPEFFGQGNMGFEAMRDIVASFHNNYFDLEDYLKGAI